MNYNELDNLLFRKIELSDGESSIGTLEYRLKNILRENHILYLRDFEKEYEKLVENDVFYKEGITRFPSVPLEFTDEEGEAYTFDYFKELEDSAKRNSTDLVYQLPILNQCLTFLEENRRSLPKSLTPIKEILMLVLRIIGLIAFVALAWFFIHLIQTFENDLIKIFGGLLCFGAMVVCALLALFMAMGLPEAIGNIFDAKSKKVELVEKYQDAYIKAVEYIRFRQLWHDHAMGGKSSALKKLYKHLESSTKGAHRWLSDEDLIRACERRLKNSK